MLVINADDFGRNGLATERILVGHAEKRITSTSAMVFMEDSERASLLATASGLDAGLHVNFTESLTGPNVPPWLRWNHERIRRFLRANKYALIIYNPFLRKAFREVFAAQVNEFTRLYGRTPSRFDGHQHMHLCSNMILDRILPTGAKVRRSFSFKAGEKNIFNRYYRALIDRRLAARHRVGDYFFALSQHLPISRLQRVVELAMTHDVELMTHPEVNVEFEGLLSDEFASTISRVQLETSASLERA
ncbi:MAG: ChbG/HpnK family deacetylase [Chthoniobacterales bacterium]